MTDEAEKELYKDKIASSLLQQVREIIMCDSSWSNDAKTITNESFDRAIKALEQEPCEDAISRQAVLETIDSRIEQIKRDANKINKSYSHLSFAEGVHDGYCRLKCDLRILPPVKPQRSGKWELTYRDCGVDFYLCTKCKEGRAVIDGDNYKSLDEFKMCPNCGAKMLESEE